MKRYSIDPSVQMMIQKQIESLYCRSGQCGDAPEGVVFERKEHKQYQSIIQPKK